MAAITIIRALNEQDSMTDNILVSAFTPNSIEFKFERGTATGTYATVEIDGFSFFATLVEEDYEVNTDRYLIDLAGILPAFIGVAPLTVAVADLVHTIKIDIKGYESDGTLLTTNTSHPDIDLSFGYPAIGASGGLNSMYALGTNNQRTIYHNGKFCIYWYGSDGDYDLTVDEEVTSQTVTLTNGYSIITAGVNLQKSGILEREFAPGDTYIPIVYKVAASNAVEVAWINKDGGWSFWNFREIQTRHITEKNTEIPMFSYTNYDSKGRSYDLNTMKSLIYDLDTIAVDVSHYEQLLEIAESPRVIYNDLVCRVESINDTVANCRQNLKFNISLKVDENAVSY